jgi:hypothetical protein
MDYVLLLFLYILFPLLLELRLVILFILFIISYLSFALLTAQAFLFTVKEAFGLLVFLIYLFDNRIDHFVCLLIGMLWQQSLRNLFLFFWHIKDLKQVVYVKMLQIERFQDDLANHEIDIICLHLYFFEEIIKIFLWNCILGIPSII